jgi:hypothetical protein
MKTPRIPIALQQAVMRSLRENLAKANLKLGRHYPEPVLVYQQREPPPVPPGWRKMKSALTRCCCWKTSRRL